MQHLRDGCIHKRNLMPRFVVRATVCSGVLNTHALSSVHKLLPICETSTSKMPVITVVIAHHILSTARAMHSATYKTTPCVHTVAMMCISARACESLRESP